MQCYVALYLINQHILQDEQDVYVPRSLNVTYLQGI